MTSHIPSHRKLRSRAPGLALVVATAAASASSAYGCASAGMTSPEASTDASTDASSDGAASGGEGGGGSSTAPPKALGVSLFSDTCTAGTTTVDWSPMRRISRVEYDNMVRDLLGDTSQPSVTFQIPAEAELGNGINLPQVNTYAPADTTAVAQYLQAAESVAENAVADTNRMNNVILAGIPSCAQAHDDTCAMAFIAAWVNRAYRGQLDATESANLFSMFQAVEAQFDWTTGIQSILTAVLESPRFLYVLEFGNGSPTGAIVPLSSYEVAARLAFFLWRSVPDDKVMADAAMGTLATPAGVLAEAQYMLTTVNPVTQALSAQDAIDDFTNQWLQLTGVLAKDVQFSNFNANPNLAAEMYDEARLDVSNLVLTANGSLTDLLTSTSTYVTSDLAQFYAATSEGTGPSVVGPVTNASFTQMTLPNRPGILANGGVMATQAHSTLPTLVWRGKLVRENLLCDPIGPPPPQVNTTPPNAAPDGGTTTRDLLLAHSIPACASCHQLMDLIGAGFGNFDATGAYQATDANGFSGSFPPIDASGQVFAGAPPIIPAADPGALATTFQNLTDLVTQLAGSTQGEQCFALQQFRYAVGRLESKDDACSAQQVFAAFSTNTFNIQQLLVAIALSDAMRYRPYATAESSCQ